MRNASNLELALLGLLKQKPQSGYDLRKTFGTTAMRHFSDSPGSIYPALRRMEARGWITSDGKPPNQSEDRRKRLVFHLTAEGESLLVAWLEQPVTRQGVIWQLPELMLRFAFMDGNVPRSTTRRFLAQLEQELASYAGELRVQFERSLSEISLNTGLLAFQSGVEGFEAQLAWARQARAHLEENAP
jgi:DNA-binding PadR family transcriptional regulator